MNVKKWLRGLCAAVLCVAYVGTAGAAELQKVPTAWMGAQETFPIWYAKQKGWDKEVGLDVELLYFSSGMDALSTLPAKTWVFGGMGAIPALMGASWAAATAEFCSLSVIAGLTISSSATRCAATALPSSARPFPRPTSP